MTEKTQKYKSRLQALETDYKPWKSLYKEIRENFNPFAGWFPTEDNKSFDPLKYDNRYNCNVTRSWRIFESGMLQGLCSPSRPWLQLGSLDPDMNQFTQFRQWWDFLEKLLLNAFAQSNFYQVQRTGLGEQGGFGGTAYMPEPLPGPPFVWFYHFPVGSYRLATGRRGMIDTIYRPIKMQARDMAFMFGIDRLSNAVQQAVKNNPYSWFDVVHVIEPRDQSERDYSKIDNTNMAWASCWFESGESFKTLRKSGYPVFPVITPRMIPMGPMAYGVGPGLDALKRTKMLQRMELDGLKALHREIDPPLAVPSRFDGVLDLTPGAPNYVHDADTKASISPILSVSLNWQWFQNRLDRMEESVDRAFMVDLFLMILNSTDSEDPRRTATEVVKRYEEKMTILGPVTENQHVDNFDKVIDLVLNMFFSIPGLVPPPPQELQGQPIKAKYISILAQAQKMAELGKLNSFFDISDRVATYDPKTVLAINNYNALKEAEEATGIPANILRGEDEYQQRLQAAQQQEAQAAAMATVEQGARAAKDLGGASTKEGTALGDLVK